jgi:hypothetical protein
MDLAPVPEPAAADGCVFLAPVRARNGCVIAARAAEPLSSQGPVEDRSGSATDVSVLDWLDREIESLLIQSVFNRLSKLAGGIGGDKDALYPSAENVVTLLLWLRG